MSLEASAGPQPLPPGTTVEKASVNGADLLSPTAVPRGTVLEFEVVLGARPIPVMARVAESRAMGPARYALATEFVAMAQVDRDSLADFLQAVGPTSLTVRALRDQ